VFKEAILQIEFIAHGLLASNPITKQVAATCQEKYYLGQELKTHKKKASFKN
jgi:hypothetical protein